jgi:hypothetical protein
MVASTVNDVKKIHCLHGVRHPQVLDMGILQNSTSLQAEC